jgi:hypothetical protein
MPRFSAPRFACLLVLALIAAGAAAAKPPSLSACLKASAKTGAPLPAVTYSDMHGLWGGKTLTLDADGRYTRVQAEPGQPPQRAEARVDPARHRALVGLLIELKIWQQRVPKRIAVPDESAASLRIRCGTAEAAIWEWYNDLEKHRRIARVRDALGALEAAAAP